MREILREKVIAVCDEKIAKKGTNVGLSSKISKYKRQPYRPLLAGYCQLYPTPGRLCSLPPPLGHPQLKPICPYIHGKWHVLRYAHKVFEFSKKANAPRKWKVAYKFNLRYLVYRTF
jgi:hypothetical protein